MEAKQNILRSQHDICKEKSHFTNLLKLFDGIRLHVDKGDPVCSDSSGF